MHGAGSQNRRTRLTYDGDDALRPGEILQRRVHAWVQRHPPADDTRARAFTIALSAPRAPSRVITVFRPPRCPENGNRARAPDASPIDLDLGLTVHGRVPGYSHSDGRARV